MEEIINLLSKRDKTRLLIIEKYKKEYSKLVESGVIKPQRAFIQIADEVCYTRYGVAKILQNVGLYKARGISNKK